MKMISPAIHYVTREIAFREIRKRIDSLNMSQVYSAMETRPIRLIKVHIMDTISHPLSD